MTIHLLLVEDDEVSRAFLSAALESLPARVDAVACIADAAVFAGHARHDAWIVDGFLPDGDGVLALSTLRAIRPDVPAFAVTAEDDREVLDALCAAGFLDVLRKPVSVAHLQAAVRRCLGQSPPLPFIGDGKLPAWDEQQALSAIGGRRDALLALRALFIAELPGQRDAAFAAADAGDNATLQALLHKLKASAGFVGAARLLQAVHAWSDAPRDSRWRAAFTAAVEDQLSAAMDPDVDRDPDRLPAA